MTTPPAATEPTLPTPTDQHLTPDGFAQLVVSSVVHDTDESVVVTLDTDGVADLDFSFRPGQHITMRRMFDNDGEQVEVRRSYSLCSRAPDGPLRVAIRRVDGGVFSTWATTEMDVGDVLDVMPARGGFTTELHPELARSYTLIAGGSGITPLYSIAATVLALEPLSTVDLLYVNRTASTAMLLDDLLDLRDRFLDRFRVSLIFTREETAGALLSGRPDITRFADLIKAGLVPIDSDAVFACGPEALLDTATEALTAAGVPSDRIHRELFTTAQIGRVRTAPQPVTETSEVVATAQVTLHGRTSTVDVFDGDTVLEAVERVRTDAPYSCRAGVCSTCQAIVTSGATTMDVNVGLTDDEVARGYVLTCQARPTGPSTTLDVDFDV